jgi:hypothetical protein
MTDRAFAPERSTKTVADATEWRVAHGVREASRGVSGDGDSGRHENSKLIVFGLEVRLAVSVFNLTLNVATSTNVPADAITR